MDVQGHRRFAKAITEKPESMIASTVVPNAGYIALLMVFMAQGTPVEHIFNYKYVAAEIIHTVIGSFGLVSVAPFTALCAGMMLTKKK